MADEKLEVEITADDKATSVLSGIQNVLGGLGSLAMGALTVATAAATAAFVGLGAVIADSVSEAMEAQDVLGQLDAVLQSTGGVAGITSEMVTDLASSLQLVTRFSDESIISGENLLLTFTNIGKDVFPEATAVMLDMSTALKQDLSASAVQLGKALQDPILGITALKRVGVNFSEADKELIQTLVESGQVMEAQKFILAELQKEFGGSAEAAGKTFAGQLDILKNRFSEIKEELGLKVIPILQMLTDKVIIPLIPFIEKAAEVFGDLLTSFANSTDFQNFLFNVSTGLINIGKAMAGLMSGNLSIGDFFSQIFASNDGGGGAKGLGDIDIAGWLIDMISNIDWPALGAFFGQKLGELFALGADFVAGIDWAGIAERLKTAFSTAINATSDFFSGIDWTKVSQDLATGIDNVDWTNIGEAFRSIWDILFSKDISVQKIFGALLDILTSIDWHALMVAIGQAEFEFMLGVFGMNEAQFGEFMKKFWTDIGNGIKNAFIDVADTLMGPLDEIALGVWGIAEAFGGWLTSIVDVKDALQGLSIPSWLTPGSPTPLEMGLLGIHDAMNQVSGASFPSFGGATGSQLDGMAGGAAGGTTVMVNLTWAPAYSSASRADVEKLAPIIDELIKRTLRDLGK